MLIDDPKKWSRWRGTSFLEKVGACSTDRPWATEGKRDKKSPKVGAADSVIILERNYETDAPKTVK